MTEEYDPRDPLFIQVGRALSTWSTIESILEFYFQFLLGAKDAQTAQVVFSTMGFVQKRESINDLILHHNGRIPDPELLNQWETIYGNLVNQYKSRNKLAHWQYISVADGKNPEKVKPMIVRSMMDQRHVDVSKRRWPEIYKGSLDENAVAGIVKNYSKTVSLLMKFQIVLIRYLSETKADPTIIPR